MPEHDMNALIRRAAGRLPDDEDAERDEEGGYVSMSDRIRLAAGRKRARRPRLAAMERRKRDEG